MTADLAATVARNGYAVVPGVLDAALVAAARRACDEHYAGLPPARLAGDEMAASELLTIDEAAAIPFQPAVVAALRALLGGTGLWYYPNLTVRRDLFVPWHIDMAFAGKPKLARHLQCAVYLQANDAVAAGGLDAVPGSHRGPGEQPDPDGEQADAVVVASGPGDLVVWDSHVVHRSTPGRAAGAEPKYGIHFAVSEPDVVHANAYLCHLLSRRWQRGEDGPRLVARYAELGRLQYPRDYPPVVRRLVDGAGVEVVGFTL